ncbi:DUF1775 domain-containing protein [Streptomyces sp. NPDC088387]|uniref:DUF1775 domain-containing protein n=1 Tax=Streptomyces sp. NPDC088387 TaxID=3365859 RepID=UPI003810BDE3
MHRSTPARSSRRLAALTGVAFAIALATAAPAAAHAEVEADGARALDQNAELTFSAASESASAGITKLEVILPEGITPADITYKEGPDGWKYATTSRGYTVSGTKLPVGENAEYVVTVRQLPDAESLVFKTLQSYSDGKVDRWIELEDTGDEHGHGHPAPRLDLEPAAPGAKPVSPTPTEEPTTAAPSDSASDAKAAESSAPDAEAAADSTEEDNGMSVAVPVAIVAGVVVLGGGAWWLRSRRAGDA